MSIGNSGGDAANNNEKTTLFLAEQGTSPLKGQKRAFFMEILFENLPVPVQKNNGANYFDATAVAKKHGKKINDWLRGNETKAYIEALLESYGGNSRHNSDTGSNCQAPSLKMGEDNITP